MLQRTRHHHDVQSLEPRRYRGRYRCDRLRCSNGARQGCIVASSSDGRQVAGRDGGLYFGVAGVVWALDHLARVGAIAPTPDLLPVLATALERNAPWFASTSYPRRGSN